MQTVRRFDYKSLVSCKTVCRYVMLTGKFVGLIICELPVKVKFAFFTENVKNDILLLLNVILLLLNFYEHFTYERLY